MDRRDHQDAHGDRAPAIRLRVADTVLGISESGAERLEALLTLIDGARHSLRMLFYIFADDAVGGRVLTALCDAAQRGVKVTLIVDSFGSSATDDRFFRRLQTAGGKYSYFSRKWRTSYLIRNHQKLVIADDVRAMIGGFNIADAYFDDGPDGWHDLGLRIDGNAVAPMVDWFDRVDQFVDHYDGQWFQLRRMLGGWSGGNGSLRWLVSGPTRRLSPLAKSLKSDLQTGQRLDMVMAYFSPGQGMLRRIGKIARRGGARVVLPSRSDNGATIGAARLLYGFMLKRNVCIAEYGPQKLHSKLVVIDDVTYIGSANFDMRSLFLNLELMLRIDDAGFADAMRGLVSRQMQHSAVVTRAAHKARRTWLNRVRWALSWLVVGVADYTIARRFNVGIRPQSGTETGVI